MSKFDLLDKALNKYSKNKNNKKLVPGKNSCSHPSIITEKNIDICESCGNRFEKKMSHEKEWRYYGQLDSRHGSDPNRVQSRKSEERSIYKDVENMSHMLN